MTYLQREWNNYQHRDWRFLLVMLAVIEDGARWLKFPWQTLRPVWFLRGRLTEGKDRRLLRRFVRQWAKRGIGSSHYFYDYEHKREDRHGEVVVVAINWEPDRRKG